MKIELKKLKYDKDKRLDVRILSASLYINGNEVGIVSNTGRDLIRIEVRSNENARKLLAEAKMYSRSLFPDRSWLDEDRYGSLEFQLEILLEKCVKEKQLQEIQNETKQKMDIGIVVKMSNGDFEVWELPHPMTIEKVLKYDGAELVRKILEEKVIPNLVEGSVILNTNIPTKILQEAGLSKNQYAIQSKNVMIESQDKSLKQIPKGRKF
jgi:hypothetical protein